MPSTPPSTRWRRRWSSSGATSMRIRVQELPKSGLIACIGPDEGPVVLLRADLDALPVEDQTTDPWRSRNHGITHACGHDVHTACLLGAGLALQRVHREHPLPAQV